MFLLKQFLKPLILPPTPWFVLLILIAVFWHRRWARKLFWVVIVLVYALHSGYVGYQLRYPLESRYGPVIDPQRAEPYDAIVVLLAGVMPAGGLAPLPMIDEMMFRRLDEAWRLYRIRPKPIVVSGGHVNPLTPPRNENQIVCDYLILWGVPKAQVIGEAASRDTFESAVEVEKILRQRGWKRYLLVTSAIHMPRSMLAFASVAPQPIPAPGDFTIRSGRGNPFPSEDAARKIFDAVHEYIGLADYYWRAEQWEKMRAENEKSAPKQ
ncbi:MAG TPA: YdcF family protein [Candidatus Binatia bacterium]|jgi:uncharacterized SAM-binding protein YcdF (DUF218 family)